MNGAAAGEPPATIAAGVRIGFGCRVVICRLAGTVCGGSYRCGDGCRCRIEHGLTVVGRVAAMAMAVTCRSIVIGLLEELDEVRRIGECTLVADLRNRLVGRDQQQPCMHETLFDEPAVGRFEVVLLELLFERGERAVAQPGQVVDGDVVEDVREDDLFETLFRAVGISHYLAFDAVVLLRDDQVDQFGHLEVFGGFVVGEEFVLDILVCGREEVSDVVRGGIYDV